MTLALPPRRPAGSGLRNPGRAPALRPQVALATTQETPLAQPLEHRFLRLSQMFILVIAIVHLVALAGGDSLVMFGSPPGRGLRAVAA